MSASRFGANRRSLAPRDSRDSRFEQPWPQGPAARLCRAAGAAHFFRLLPYCLQVQKITAGGLGPLSRCDAPHASGQRFLTRVTAQPLAHPIDKRGRESTGVQTWQTGSSHAKSLLTAGQTGLSGLYSIQHAHLVLIPLFKGINQGSRQRCPLCPSLSTGGDRAILSLSLCLFSECGTWTGPDCLVDVQIYVTLKFLLTVAAHSDCPVQVSAQGAQSVFGFVMALPASCRRVDLYILCKGETRKGTAQSGGSLSP